MPLALYPGVFSYTRKRPTTVGVDGLPELISKIAFTRPPGSISASTCLVRSASTCLPSLR